MLIGEYKVHSSWAHFLQPLCEQQEYIALQQKIQLERNSEVIYPPQEQVFQCFELTPFEDVKVVILGQDPYHGPGQAHGLSFSIADNSIINSKSRSCKRKESITIPPSLRNIQKELQIPPDIAQKTGCLVSWAKQGVLLLNSVLTVQSGVAGSHRGYGWQILTDQVISLLSAQRKGIVFLLWGQDAGQKSTLIHQDKHLVLQAPHPSPLSAYRGFFGCDHFNKANQYLQKKGVGAIDWYKPWR